MENRAKILLLDIETAPSLGYVWAKYETNVIEFTREWYILCFSYKWLGDKGVKSYALCDFLSYKKDIENDKELCKRLWDLFDEADVIIAHNGNSFDIKKSNARFLVHGFKSPAPYKTIDTKLIAKRYFNFNGNSLNDLGKVLGAGQKLSHGGFELWKGCMSGDKKAWGLMVRYNKQDVVLLEQLYKIMLPWMTNHPNIALLNNKKMGCQNCGSSNINKKGFFYTQFNRYQRYRCMDCGAQFKAEIIKKGGL